MKILIAICLLILSTALVDSCAKSQAETKTVAIMLPTAKCETCKKNIESALRLVPGVENAIVTGSTQKSVQVVYDPATTSEQKVCEAITNAGYNAGSMPRNSAAYDKLDDCCK